MKKVLLSSVLALALVSSSLYGVENNNTAETKAVSTKALKSAKDSANAHKSDIKVIQEAVDAVKLTQEVLISLDKKDKEGAIKQLEKAIGKLEVVLSNPKAPALIPLSANVVVSEFPQSARVAENAIITATALLSKGKVQAAREIVVGLKDEIDFVTVNLPLASYPASLKLAAKFLHEDKVEEAKRVLATALSTFVEVNVVTPIGIIKAQSLIEAASKVAKDNKKLALSHLEEAKKSLKKSEVLGYVSESDTTYKMLNDAIVELEKEIKGKNDSGKLFDELIEKIKEFKEKAVKSVTK
jgi:carbonic anhydrase/acetyltransferase-like protein (isoleucine patch superfamily)